MRRSSDFDADIASVAAAIADPSRATMLAALADGRALPAGELARVAHVSPQTASSHLDKLFRRHLLAVEVQGRHHYYRLRNSRVAELLESLAVVARPLELRSGIHGDAARALRFARTCYGHLAGVLGVAVADALCAKGRISADDASFRPTSRGEAWFRRIGIEVRSLDRRPLARRCLDWSERRHHLAGALGVAMTRRMLELAWLRRIDESRALELTPRGAGVLHAELGIKT